ncbi:MAG: DivIVA domain-containing protein [Candidatus Eisenbacteria sp.]|nr:DivIVA domain-containing protein [Candidatus Eisenbacteria bacterium]
MKLTPLEVRKQSFRKSWRGFDAEEVRIFLEMVADEYERALQENGMLSEKVRYLNERLEEYHSLEKTLQNSILTAERMSAESRDHTRLEAERVIDDAHVRAERILEDSRNRLRRLGDQVQHLAKQKDLFIQRFKSLLEAQTQFLCSSEEELEAIDDLDAQTSALTAELFQQPSLPESDPAEAEESSISGLVADAPRITPAREAPSGSSSSADPAEPEPADRLSRPPASRDAPDSTSGGQWDTAAQGEGNGFFPPVERREGFFDLNAKPDSKQESQEGTRR